jgi:hypothetical protein
MSTIALIAACTSSSNDRGPTTPSADGDFEGVIAVPGNSASSAAFILSTGHSTTGVLTQATGISGLLVGTYDLSKGVVSATGLGYTLSASVSGGTFAGRGYVNTGQQFVQVGMVGVSAPTSATEAWVGSARSNAGQNCGNPKQSASQFQFVLHPAASGYSVIGQAMNDTDGTRMTFAGTATFSTTSDTGTMNVTMDAPAGYASATGALSNGAWTGTYRGGDTTGCEQGTWTAVRLK